MRTVAFPAWLVVLCAAHSIPALAGSGAAIYRCGNEYLNDAASAQARGCSLVEGNGPAVTVTGTQVQSQAPKSAHSIAAMPVSGSASVASAPAQAVPTVSRWRSGSVEPQRDRDALSILQAELGKAETLLAERQRDLADPQRHPSRVADLQGSISRHLSDIASLKREISRLVGQSTLRSK
jgi:hypothetical protein